MVILSFFSNLSPFKRVILALILGISAGLIFGEPMGNLEVMGVVYIRLLQMTVLPYILVSIIGGLGRLDSHMAGRIGMKAIRVILIIWLAVMLTLILLPLAYPNWETSGFFSSSLVTEVPPFNFVDLYIPSNIFSSLSNTIVPAVVLFSLLMGVSLINVKNKEPFITLTNSVADTLMGVASFVAKLAPFGIFAISSAAAGTLDPEELGRLQVFLWVYLIAAALLGLVLLPLILHWATPFSYRRILSVSGEAVITALATGTVLVVLPMIIERCKAMLEEEGMACEETMSTVDVLVPTAYSFPSTGTLLGLGFILFSSWYVGSPLSIDQYPSYITMGALSAFGSMAVAIPFMLDFFGLPADQFQLYLLGSVVTARFATGLAALHGFVVTLLVASAVMRRLKWHRLFQAIGLHLGVTAGVMILAGFALTNLIPYEYSGSRDFESMRLIGTQQAKIKQVTKPEPLSAEQQTRSRLDVILERGSIRVGYFSNSLPYSFRNNKAELVGYDMEIIHELAGDLNLKVEYSHIKKRGLEAKMLADGRIDIAIGGTAITPLTALQVTYTQPYMHHTAGMVVRDKLRDDFSSMANINAMENLTIAVPKSSYYARLVKHYFPNAEQVEVSSAREFFKGKHKGVDAFIYSTEAGSAWSLLYPEYTVVVPKGLKFKVPAAFELPKDQLAYARYINTWLTLKSENGFLEKAYQYWIFGIDPKPKAPRWSVVRNVFGWNI
ncbi:cation:dicarboxylate symporter family transporter [sulfur-oxidizing endosymbiont of Gigantopelta aegis]|uniref:cation:dicarboxylate symporter family transporter n=1 Tax=sulfur-oxidizing endosymbiont of Gigantopelta aegis TaxID=2794934 RepID=UPI0018DE5AA0|nr:cation:dicarboxylase symporter family transporter [sulfur-oxidizing endosymbiont of Gigantopelta aegis]